MTLIAQLSVNGAPFLIGDVLLSSETRKGLKVNLPLVGDINQILADRGLEFEVSFAQKIHVFDGRIAVAWSGPVVQAERALRVLAAISSRQALTRSDIVAELNAIDPSAIDQLQLIGILLRGVTGMTVEASIFSLRVQPVNIPNIGSVYCAGTGRDSFFELLQQTNRQSTTEANEYQVAHGLLGALTNKEFITGNTIANRWGGGFEAVTFSATSSRFEKVGDILHTFWRVTENSADPINLLPYFYKTTYWQDLLVIRAASLDFSSTVKLKTNDIQLIPPLLKDIGDYNLADLKPVDFSYRSVCCHVLIEKSEGQDTLLLIDQREGEQAILFTVDESGGRLHLTEYLPCIIREQLDLICEVKT